MSKEIRTKESLLHDLNNSIASDNGRIIFDKDKHFVLDHTNKLTSKSLIWIPKLDSWVDTNHEIFDPKSSKRYTKYKDLKFSFWFKNNGHMLMYHAEHPDRPREYATMSMPFKCKF